MTETLRSRATAEARNSFRATASWTACRLAAGGILFAIVCTISAGASAQWDAVLRNLMQNTMPASPPGMSAYPPSNPGYPPPSAAPPNAGYPAYAAPPSTASHPPPHASSAAPDAGMVADLQRILNELGYDAGPADGAPGSRTIQAVRAFQRDHGQPPSDEVTATTLASVRGVWYERNRTAASTSVAANQTSERPSFDCARATTAVESTICRSNELSRLDSELGQLFDTVRLSVPEARVADLRSSQRQWLAERDRCGADAPCIQRSIGGRFDALEAERSAVAGQPRVVPGLPIAAVASDSPPSVAIPLGGQVLANATTKFETATAPEKMDLIRLLMAARPDLYRSDPVAIVVYGMMMGGDSPRCAATRADMANELRRPQVIAAAHRQVEAILADAGRSPTKLFRVTAAVQLGHYDPNENAFALPTSSPQSLLGGNAMYPELTLQYRVGSNCHLELTLGAASGFAFRSGSVVDPQLLVSGGDKVKTLPMPRAAAKKYLDRGEQGRKITIEALVEATASETGLSGTVVAARALDPTNGAILHIYDSALFDQAQPGSGGAASLTDPHARTIDFAAVHPADLRALLTLRMALHPEKYSGDNFAIFWKALNVRSGTEECTRISAAVRNEIRRVDYLAEANKELEEALASAKVSAPVLLRFSNPAGLRNYDASSQSFPLEARGGYAPGSILAPLQHFTFRVPEGICGSAAEGGSQAEELSRGLTVSIQGGEKLKQLPMDPDAAEARLASTKGDPRSVFLEAVVQMSDGDQGLKGRIIAARAIDIESGKVLHVYDPAFFAQDGPAFTSGTDVKTGAEAPVAATRSVLLFEGLRYVPEQIGDKALAVITRRQADSDQRAYEFAGSSESNGNEHVFVFAADDVRGRAIDFVAPALASKMRAFLDKTAAQSAASLWTSNRLIGLQYDHARQMFRPAPGTQILSTPSSFYHGVNLRSLSPYAKGSRASAQPSD